jgi:hypothetical protein
MYTTKITKVEQSGNLAEITVEYYKDGVLVDTQIHRTGEPETLSGIAQQQINEYKRRDVLADFIANPPLNQEAVKTQVLTQEQIDKQIYEFKRQEVFSAKADLDLGIIDQATYDKKLADVVSIKPVEIVIP